MELVIYWLSIVGLLVGIALMVMLVSWAKTFVNRGD